ELFGDRIEEKNELLRRMEEGRAVGALPPSETDEDVEIPSIVVPPERAPPTIASSAAVPASTMPASTVLAPASLETPAPPARRARLAIIGGLAAALVLGLGVSPWAASHEPTSPVVAAAPPAPPPTAP